MKKYSKECSLCHVPYMGHKSYQRFCGHACANKARIRKIATNKKISDSLRGITREQRYGAEKARKIIEKIVRCGPLNGNWKGGTSTLGNRIRSLKIYKEWRKNIIIRDSGLCRLCGKTGKIVDHYPVPFSILIKIFRICTIDDARNCRWLWNKNNGRIICANCEARLPSHAMWSGIIEKEYLILKMKNLVDILISLDAYLKEK
jgi:hypothetical protein